MARTVAVILAVEVEVVVQGVAPELGELMVNAKAGKV
jgi:hypothetical protein